MGVAQQIREAQGKSNEGYGRIDVSKGVSKYIRGDREVSQDAVYYNKKSSSGSGGSSSVDREPTAKEFIKEIEEIQKTTPLTIRDVETYAEQRSPSYRRLKTVSREQERRQAQSTIKEVLGRELTEKEIELISKDQLKKIKRQDGQTLEVSDVGLRLTGKAEQQPSIPQNLPTSEKSDYERRIEDLVEWEKAAAARNQAYADRWKKLPGLGGDSFIQGLGRSVLAAPARITLGFGEQLMLGGAKIAAAGEALTREDTRKYVKNYFTQAAKDTQPAVKQAYADFSNPDTLVNIGLAGLGVRGLAKGKITQRVFSKAKKQQSNVKISEYTGFKQTVKVVKSDVVMTGKGKTVSVKGVAPETVYKIYEPSAPVKVVSGSAKGVITPKGTQYTTQKVNVAGKSFFVRTKAGPKNTITKIFEGDKLVRKVQTRTQPDIYFTEPKASAAKNQVISLSEFRADQVNRAYTQRGVSAINKRILSSSYRPEGRGVIAETKQMVAVTKRPGAVAKSEGPLIYDFQKGTIRPSKLVIEPYTTRYKFTRSPPKADPFLFKLIDKPRGINVKSPTRTAVTEVYSKRSVYNIRYKKQSSLLSDFARSNIKSIGKMFASKRGQIGVSKLRTRNVQDFLPRNVKNAKFGYSSGLRVAPAIRSFIPVSSMVKSRSLVSSLSKTSSKVAPGVKSLTIPKLKYQIPTALKSLQNPITKTIPKTSVKTQVKTSSKSIVMPKALGSTKQSSFYSNVMRSSGVPAKQQIFTNLGFSSAKNKQKKIKNPVPGKDVIIIENNREMKANTQPLPKKQAYDLGYDVSENSLSASFKVVDAGVKVPKSRRRVLKTGKTVNPRNFRMSRSSKRSDFIVEKRSARINSKGEKQGLTAARLLGKMQFARNFGRRFL